AVKTHVNEIHVGKNRKNAVLQISENESSSNQITVVCTTELQ
ncbi:unnamed protein product, partial [Allacma fusca]